LVRVICPVCKTVDPDPEVPEEWVHLQMGKVGTLYRGAGCERCAGTGFWGRIGIFELFLIDDPIRRMILQGADVIQIREAARKNGMKTLLEDGLEKVKASLTTLPEVLRVTQEV
jgi:type II secretory ATPase GspE/PulE/Tfp pilus assembly ATPase PilB-like protein